MCNPRPPRADALAESSKKASPLYHTIRRPPVLPRTPLGSPGGGSTPMAAQSIELRVMCESDMAAPLLFRREGAVWGPALESAVLPRRLLCDESGDNSQTSQGQALL